MIRKAIIVVLTLAAVGMLVLAALSSYRGFELAIEWGFVERYVPEASRFEPKWVLRSLRPYSFYSQGGWAATDGDETSIVLQDGYCTVYVQRQVQQPMRPWKRSYGKHWLAFEAGVRPTIHQGGFHRYWGFYGTLFVPFLFFAAYPTLAFIRGPLRRHRRRKRGLCVRCGYNLTGLPEPRCPECGEPE